ncbi:MAG: ABC transporter ATP-binding protein [Desulfobacteraceae bacterium]|jgi:iron complex transport system ATP-binding protein
MAEAISVQNLKHAFNGRTVIDDLVFEVASGEFFIIIGPNGSGKTTLLKLMVGLLPLQNGHIDLLSKSLSEYTAKSLARQIAYVPQSVPVEFPFTVTQVVLMGRSPHLGVLGFEGDEDLRLAHDAMTFTDVAHLADRRMDQLSGGEKQRVFIACAICQQPNILVLDEPTSALDLSHQVRLMDLMERLKTEQGVTIVMVSHDLNMAAMYADQLLLLSRGRIARNGSPEQVIDYDLLEQVYGCRLLVDRSPLGDYPRVHLVPKRYLDK